MLAIQTVVGEFRSAHDQLFCCEWHRRSEIHADEPHPAYLVEQLSMVCNGAAPAGGGAMAMGMVSPRRLAVARRLVVASYLAEGFPWTLGVLSRKMRGHL